MDDDGSDIFVHYDDLMKASISKEFLKHNKQGSLRFSFCCMQYIGKYNKSRKAVDIELMRDGNFPYLPHLLSYSPNSLNNYGLSPYSDANSSLTNTLF